MKISSISSRNVVSLVGLLLLTVPAAAQEVDLAVAEVEGVRITADRNAWPSEQQLEEGITPVKVRIDNQSARDLRLRYREFVIVASTGERYAALPMLDVLDRSSEPKQKPLLSIKSPKFGQLSFRIAPAYSPLYPGSETFPSHFSENRDYTEYHEKYWNPERKPTTAMFERLLPEGVLGKGGYVDGFLFFEEVSSWAPGLRLEVRLVDAESAESFGSVSLTLRDRREAEPEASPEPPPR